MGGWEERRKEKKTKKKKKKKKSALPKRFYKIRLLQREPRKESLFANKMETKTTSRNCNTC